MEEQIITVTQKIVIKYNCEEAKNQCIKDIESSTDWMGFSEGTILDEKIQYSASKTKDIKVTE
jgi:hypothetical protein